MKKNIIFLNALTEVQGVIENLSEKLKTTPAWMMIFGFPLKKSKYCFIYISVVSVESFLCVRSFEIV
jgi:hypothetical protein